MSILIVMAMAIGMDSMRYKSEIGEATEVSQPRIWRG